MRWTKDQASAIEARGTNLLVAAVFFKTKEFRYLTDLIGSFARRILKRDKGEATA